MIARPHVLHKVAVASLTGLAFLPTPAPPPQPDKLGRLPFWQVDFHNAVAGRLPIRFVTMLVLPVRRPQNIDHDPSHELSPSVIQISRSSTGYNNIPSENMTATSSIMRPQTQGPRKPRLTLNTATGSSLPSSARSRTALCVSGVTESPTYRNTYANAFDVAPAKLKSSVQTDAATVESRCISHSSPESASTTASTTCSTSGNSSPLSAATPYVLPLGTRSILRNSPLPRRHAAGTRPPKVYFPVMKKVGFEDNNLVQYIPSVLLKRDETQDSSPDASDSELSPKRKHDPVPEDFDEIAERRQLDELLEERRSIVSPIHGRRKRRREWIWRPLDNDILGRHTVHPPTTDQPPTQGFAGVAAEDIPLPETPTASPPPGPIGDRPPSAPVQESPPMFLPATTYSPPAASGRLAGAHDYR